MVRSLVRLLVRPATYTRGLHLCLPLTVVAVWLFIDADRPYVPALLVIPLGLLPAMRLAEGVQAQLFLTPAERGKADASIAVAPAVTWSDRWRTVLWLEVRLALSAALLGVVVPMIMVGADLIGAAVGVAPVQNSLVRIQPHWWCALLVPIPLAVIFAALVPLGELITMSARRLLGPSASQQLKALEERTELLLEHNRVARELHDSIGHALTAAVLQAGAARATSDTEFTDRALLTIEETGRAALDDLDRVLGILREPGSPLHERPTLADIGTLFESAQLSGATVDAAVCGSVDRVSGPVSREGYRIMQEALTNALRHAGAVPVRVRVGIGDQLELDVTNPLPSTGVSAGDGSGLRGIRERAELLGGFAFTGPGDGSWQVHVELPLNVPG